MTSRFILLLVVLTSLSACASGARTGAMTAPVSSATIISESSSLKRAITVSEISGGKETNPLWMSNVGNNEFRAALEQSLMLHALHASASPRFKLEATLVDLKQPLGGFDVTVGSRVYYRLATADTNERVYEKDVSCEYTANFSDALLGYERLRLANEGAIKKNISIFIEDLVAEFAKRDAQAAAPSAGS
ncbi:MAG: hypothetical protein KF895_13755 [Parvibaculum sp.]|nr:hypothetical protein [Parvibaculum sp.]